MYSSNCLLVVACTSCLLLVQSISAFQPISASSLLQRFPPQRTSSSTSSSCLCATLDPSTEGGASVTVIGRGYISLLAAKLAALRGYSTNFICPPGEEDTVKSLLGEDPATSIPSNMKLVPAADTDALEKAASEMDAMLIAVDDTAVLDSGVVNYLLDANLAKQCKRVVAMSRNLNGKGMGFLATASKATANREVWDNSNKKEFEAFENAVKAACDKLDECEWTVVRSGTLKGGACGEINLTDDEGTVIEGEANPEYCPQYLSRDFYTRTKKDIVTWNLLFDCAVRGVRLSKGDTFPGPGGKAIFTATSAEVCDGDSSRAAVAEAMVRSLEISDCGNFDFGVATAAARVPPTEEEWAGLFDGM